MRTTIDRILFVQAVVDGQISSDHISTKELYKMHHMLADKEIDDLMFKNTERDDVRVFDYNQDFFLKDFYN